MSYDTIYGLILTNPYAKDVVKKYSKSFEIRGVALYLNYPSSISSTDKVISVKEAGLQGKTYTIVGVKIPARIYLNGKTEQCSFYFYSSSGYDLKFALVFEYQGEIAYTSSIYLLEEYVSTYLSHMGATGTRLTAKKYFSTYDTTYFFKGFLLGVYAVISGSSNYIVWNSKQEIDEKYEVAIKNILITLGVLN